MTDDLPILENANGKETIDSVSRIRAYAVQAIRLSIFLIIILLIHWKAKQRTRSNQPAGPIQISLEDVQQLVPSAGSLEIDQRATDAAKILDAEGNELGSAIQTSPQADKVIGFSGPTNVLLIFDSDYELKDFKILSSGDTKEHLDQVIRDKKFREELLNRSWDELSTGFRADGVSGATLTSVAINEAIVLRLSGKRPSLRFPDPPQMERVLDLFPEATSLHFDEVFPYRWQVLVNEDPIGWVLRSSPVSDQQVGYHGPTDSLLGLSKDNRVIGFTINQSFDQEPYVGYVRDDTYFRSLFNEMNIKELSVSDLESLEVEGVSGATMTSQRVAEDLLALAFKYQNDQVLQEKEDQQKPPPKRRTWNLPKVRDIGTTLVILLALAIGLSPLRGKKYLRVILQLVLIGYLGLINGDLISQAMLVGWAKVGIPWQRAFGLVLLSAVAFTIPIVTKSNIYCSHICPHGAVQQLVKRRIKWQLKLSPRVRRLLEILPAVLLVWILIVAMTGLGFSLVNLEPFDAWIFRIAGWPTIVIAIVGLAFSLFVPMGYCRFGCPTGAILSYLRFNAQSGRWSSGDWLSLSLLSLAFLLFVV